MAYEVRSLERAIELLSTLASRSPIRLTDLAEQLQSNQSTVLRTLRVLERHGYVRRASKHEYALGSRLIELGNLAAEHLDFPAAVRQWTTAFSREMHVTTHVGMLRSGMITVIDKVDSADSPIRYSSLGTRMPLHATAAGKAALALLVEDQPVRELLEEPLASYTEHTLTSIPQVAADVNVIRQRRFSTERQEYNPGFNCVGSAVRIGDDIFTISLSGPLIQEELLLERGAQLREAVDDILEQFSGAAKSITAAPQA